MRLKTVWTLFALVFATTAHSQAWSEAYEKALEAARNNDWLSAKAAFQEAIASRAEDQAGPTTLPGPVTEPRRWRNGVPYSPNFGVAYSSYRMAMAMPVGDRRTLLETARGEFETLVAKNQISAPTAYYLNFIYGALGQPEKQRELGEKTSQGLNWKVDTSFIAPDEAALVGATATTSQQGVVVNQGGAGTGPKVTLIDTNSKTTLPITALAGPVPIVDTKFALIIGNSETQMSSGGLSFAASDALAVRDALVQNTGYADSAVDMVPNGTADQMRKAAEALAARIPSEATVLIYFTGIGVNIDGKDYLAGIDAAMSSDTGKMLAKEELIGIFRAKGARVFIFQQANRPTVDGRYFGMEIPIYGQFALCQATSPDEQVYGTTMDGKVMGAYTKAFIDVLAQFRSNRVPVTEFTRKVFQTMRGGSTLTSGGGSKQVPTMPLVRNMDEDAKF